MVSRPGYCARSRNISTVPVSISTSAKPATVRRKIRCASVVAAERSESIPTIAPRKQPAPINLFPKGAPLLSRREITAALEELDHLRRGRRGVLRLSPQNEFRDLRRLVGVIDPGETFDLTGSRLL